MSVYLFKYEPYLFFSDTLEAKSKRKWKISEGDTLLYTSGIGKNLRFIGTSTVLEVEQKFVEAGEYSDSSPFYTTHLKVTPLDELPNDRTLKAFMFSLIRVTNFSKPYLHFRHKSLIDEVDLETIRSGDVDWNRSLYFGLLTSLPATQRAYLEHRAMAMRVSRERSADVNKYPADELMKLIESIILSPLTLASETGDLFSALVKRTNWSNVRLEAVSGKEDLYERPPIHTWNISKLFNSAPFLIESIQENWKIAEQLISKEIDENNFRERRRVRVWRPHKW
ncbi:hypothetical protein AB4Z21_16290 [Paenibacillus sp. MCAF20]